MIAGKRGRVNSLKKRSAVKRVSDKRDGLTRVMSRQFLGFCRHLSTLSGPDSSSLENEI